MTIITVQLIKVAKEIFEQHDEPANIRVVINENRRPVGEHARRYNSPMCDEVGVLMPNDNVNNRDIVLHYRDGSLQRISELHRGYDPLQYPLLFSYGTDGWHINLKLANGRKLTAMVYYRYHIMVRQQVPVLLKAKRLFQQFLVDAYCKIETERLQFLRREQNALLADCYQDLRDAMVDGDGDPRNVGRRVILPSSFTGGPRYMHERQQDAMTYVRKYGHPDLFITMTTNPNWPEIRNNLLPGQESLDRPDLVARVFRLKVKKLLEMLTKEMIFGKPRAWLYSTEWQKRGLPHCHLLQWLIPEHKITPDKIDDVICAETPDPMVDPELHQIVISNMVHGPCGSINPEDGRCSKSYPKQFKADTQLRADSFPLYRRRSPEDGGQVATINMRVMGSCVTQEIDNRWIVPYNKLLLRSLNCHCNVELCMSIKSIKYVLKYVHKGCDQATFALRSDQVDEISDFQNAHYKSLDTIPDESQAVHFPTEFLNSLEVSGLPQHLLLLKVGAPIIILRSLDPPRVTNGTRCVVTKLSANTVEAKISHGRYAGHDIIIPRIPLIPSNSVLPFEFRRLQFPIALCFAMTINKSQSQTFKAVGLDLTDESFTHGMLYVALSRVGSADRLTLLVRGDCKTRNVVYSEVFR